ncbi:Uncharacterised protein [Acinetobacter baumannii]|nr:Uncharacterised protein [Acinetobacter baumannii]
MGRGHRKRLFQPERQGRAADHRPGDRGHHPQTGSHRQDRRTQRSIQPSPGRQQQRRRSRLRLRRRPARQPLALRPDRRQGQPGRSVQPSQRRPGGGLELQGVFRWPAALFGGRLRRRGASDHRRALAGSPSDTQGLHRDLRYRQVLREQRRPGRYQPRPDALRHLGPANQGRSRGQHTPTDARQPAAADPGPPGRLDLRLDRSHHSHRQSEPGQLAEQ